MIHFVTAPWNAVTGHMLVWGRWGGLWRNRVRLVTYPELYREKRHRPGTYIFCDAEMLTADDKRRAGELRHQLLDSGIAERVLNDPARTLTRLALLQHLHETGVNPFNAWPIDAAVPDDAFPVFLRVADAHKGAGTPLLRDRAQLDNAVAGLRARSAHPDHWIIVQFCDTADDAGVYRKYSEFIVYDNVIARHVLFSNHWMNKARVEPTDEQAAEERAYVAANPNADHVREICKSLHIDWGRIDYSMLGDRLVIWEINTNPVVLRPNMAKDHKRVGLHDAFAQTIRKHFDQWCPPGPQPLSRRIGASLRALRYPLDEYRFRRQRRQIE